MISARRKITSWHLQRLAVVYSRQSTPAQVRFNVRSTERQYAIAEEAARLGWEPERIAIIDGDLGVSGRDTHARESYKELVARVCLGKVGAISAWRFRGWRATTRPSDERDEHVGDPPRSAAARLTPWQPAGHDVQLGLRRLRLLWG